MTSINWTIKWTTKTSPEFLRIVWSLVSFGFGICFGFRVSIFEFGPRPTFLLSSALALLCWSLAAAAPLAADWPTYHGDRALTGVAAGPLPAPGKLVRLWRYHAGSSVSVPPVAGGGRVFFVNEDGQVGAVSLAGAAAWLAAPPAATNSGDRVYFSAPPLLVGELVVAGTSRGALCALEADTGRLRWETNACGGIQGTATWVERRDSPGAALVVISQPEGSLHCFDALTGRRLWQSKPTNRTDGSPAASGDWIVFGNCDAALHVFAAASGDELRAIPLGEGAQVAGGVALDGGMIYAGSRGGDVVCADARSGRIVWKSHGSEAEVFTTPAVDGRHVVYGANDGGVYALAREDGRQLWRAEVGASPGSPAIAGSHVAATGGGSLYLLRLEDGLPVWSNRVSDQITSPAVAAGCIFLGTGEGDIVAFGAARSGK